MSLGNCVFNLLNFTLRDDGTGAGRTYEASLTGSAVRGMNGTKSVLGKLRPVG